MSQPITRASLQDLSELDSLVGRIENELKKFVHVEDYVPDTLLSELKKFRNVIEREYEKRNRF